MAKVNFEIYDVTACLTKKYNTHIAQYPDNKIWSLTRAFQEKWFFLKIMQTMRQEPDRFLFFKKALYQVKTSDLQLDFTIISIALKLAYNRNKLFKTLHCWSRDMLNSDFDFDFDLLDKSLGIVSPAYVVYDFSATMFLMLYSINWSNFIAWLLLLLETLGNMCIAITC